MNKHRVLVVEHDAIVTLDLLESLVEAGYEVACVRGAKSALHMALSLEIDLVILDADGDDSWETAQQLRSRAGANLLYLTTASQPGFCSQQGAPPIVVAKPFCTSELIETVTRFLAVQGRAGSVPRTQPEAPSRPHSHAA